MSKGHMMPHNEAAFAQVVEALREQFLKLSPGQWFEGRFGLDQKGNIAPESVAIKPPQIHPVKRP